jgi:septal ring factor EnvC (AmiA/AmiB activator)
VALRALRAKARHLGDLGVLGGSTLSRRFAATSRRPHRRRSLAVAFAAIALTAAATPPPDAAKVEDLRWRLVRLGEDQASGEARAIQAREQLRRLNAREAALTAEIGANRAQLTRLLSALQLMTREPPPPLLVSPKRANEAVRAAILMRAVEPVLQSRAEALARQAAEIAKLRRETALQGERLFTAESQLADRRAAIERLAHQKGALEQSLNPTDDTAVREAARRALDPAALVHDLDAKAATASSPSTAALTAAPSSAPGPIAPGEGRLIPPVAGQLVRRWGERPGGHSRSQGVAWRTEPQAQVRAPAGGKIDYAGPLKGWGQIVVLRMSDQMRIVLTGLDRLDTATGRSVAAGEPIGSMGQARNPPPEVYLELRRDGAPIDPSRWLDGRPGA